MGTGPSYPLSTASAVVDGGGGWKAADARSSATPCEPWHAASCPMATDHEAIAASSDHPEALREGRPVCFLTQPSSRPAIIVPAQQHRRHFRHGGSASCTATAGSAQRRLDTSPLARHKLYLVSHLHFPAGRTCADHRRTGSLPGPARPGCHLAALKPPQGSLVKEHISLQRSCYSPPPC
jgi:hypothetical protein